MLENHINTLFLGDLADFANPMILTIINHMICAEFKAFVEFVIGADSRNDGAADFLRQLDGRRADTRTSGMNEYCFAGLKSGIVKEHVLAGAKCYRRHGGGNVGKAFWCAYDVAGRHIGKILGVAVQVKTVNALWMFAMIVPAFAAWAANAASGSAIDGDQVTGLET